MEELPFYVSIIFGSIVVLSIFWFYKITHSLRFAGLAGLWVLLQSALGYSGWYQVTNSMPPRILLFGVLPSLLIIAALFLTKSGRAFVDSFNLRSLTWFHTLRLPIEIMLAVLYHQGVMSIYITYEGSNFDILSGLSAPLMAYLAFRNGIVNRKALMAWNVLCLLLLFNVVITAVFAIPSPFQKLAFDQPNIAVLYFPFNLLPTFLVPAVLFAHLVAFRQLKNMPDTR